MRLCLLNWLACPECHGELIFYGDGAFSGEHLIEGQLQCELCGMIYNVHAGVPILLPKANEWNEKLTILKSETVEKFGFEWRYFKRWGWIEHLPSIPEAAEKFFGGLLEHTKSAFTSKSMFETDKLIAGKLILDAGCGNGRFCRAASVNGAEVIGIDIGPGVFSAFQNSRNIPNVHIVMGDLHTLPLKDNIFDYIFSIGVLMHTGDAEKAFEVILRSLKPCGCITAHVYGIGRCSYELLDRVIREVTVRMPLNAQRFFSVFCAILARWLRKEHPGVYERIFSHLNLLPTEIHMFDWWAAPIATHHELEEVVGWFESRGCEVLQTNPPRYNIEAERKRRRGHGAVTVKGRKLHPLPDPVEP